jgi:hypothetical protein
MRHAMPNPASASSVRTRKIARAFPDTARKSPHYLQLFSALCHSFQDLDVTICNFLCNRSACEPV